jgi:predicted 3-demethylubiquinone-9 3-methyltransferase (glyoxalase superfamily)
METNNQTDTIAEPGTEWPTTIKSQKIIPFLWYNDEAEEAMGFYTSIFKNGKITSIRRYGDAGPGKKGTVMTGTFKLGHQEFYALNGGPVFGFTPAISLSVNCQTEEEINALWKNLAHNGTILMELKKYPFSQKYGWVQDRFGLSWQLNLTGTPLSIAPCLLFANEQHGKAEAAIRFYTSQFKRAEVISMMRYGPAEEGMEGTVKHTSFLLNDGMFMAMDSPIAQPFNFTPAISFFVNCETQEEVDNFWEKLSEGGEKSQCGWLKDRYGISWQIVPSILIKLMSDPDPERNNRVMKAMLQMHKLDIAELTKAYEG